MRLVLREGVAMAMLAPRAGAFERTAARKTRM
jgi:hypothetical protein